MSRQQRRAQERRRTRPRRRTLGLGTIAAGIIVLLAVIGLIGYAATRQSAPKATPAPTATSLAPTVDGIHCGAMEALAYHIHQYLELYDHGKRIPVPSEIGIPGGEAAPICFYWIHVHEATPDIIHVESPVHKTFTLGDFFDIWAATKRWAVPPGDAYVKDLAVAARRGVVTAFLNGKPWHGSYRSIPLREHEVIAVEIGKPVVPPRPFHNWNGL